jgi:hypothetical protein
LTSGADSWEVKKATTAMMRKAGKRIPAREYLPSASASV